MEIDEHAQRLHELEAVEENPNNGNDVQGNVENIVKKRSLLEKMIQANRGKMFTQT